MDNDYARARICRDVRPSDDRARAAQTSSSRAGALGAAKTYVPQTCTMPRPHPFHRHIATLSGSLSLISRREDLPFSTTGSKFSAGKASPQS